MCIQNEGWVCGLNVAYLLMLHETYYRTCEPLLEGSSRQEGHTLIKFKGSRVSLRCCVLVYKPCMLVVRHKLRISICVGERSRILQYLSYLLKVTKYIIFVLEQSGKWIPLLCTKQRFFSQKKTEAWNKNKYNYSRCNLHIKFCIKS